MKLTINPPKTNVAEPVAQAPAPIPAQPVAKVNPLNALLAKKQETGLANTAAKNPLAQALAAKSAPQLPGIVAKSSVPTLAVKTERYVLIENAPENIKPETVANFSAKMQALMDYMDSSDLPNALKDLKLYCDEHKELKAILRPYDVQLFTRAARKSYGMTVIAKMSNQTKRGKKTVQQNAIGQDALEILGGLDLGLGF